MQSKCPSNSQLSEYKIFTRNIAIFVSRKLGMVHNCVRILDMNLNFLMKVLICWGLQIPLTSHPPPHAHTHTHTHTCKCRQTWTLKIIWNYNAKTRTRVCEIALANRGHPHRVCDISLANRGLTPATLLFFFLHVYPHAFAFVCTISLIEGNRGQSTVAVLSSIWFWCVGSCPWFPVKTNAHTHTHTYSEVTVKKLIFYVIKSWM